MHQVQQMYSSLVHPDARVRPSTRTAQGLEIFFAQLVRNVPIRYDSYRTSWANFGLLGLSFDPSEKLDISLDMNGLFTKNLDDPGGKLSGCGGTGLSSFGSLNFIRFRELLSHCAVHFHPIGPFSPRPPNFTSTLF